MNFVPWINKDNQNKYSYNIALSPGQTIATCQRNISQRCWAHHNVCRWLVKFEPTIPSMSQHVAKGWPNGRNMLAITWGIRAQSASSEWNE